MAAMNRTSVGRAAGIIGGLAGLFPWLGLALVEIYRDRMPPLIGLYGLLGIMFAGVVLTTVAAVLHSRWWLLAVAGAVATFAFFVVGGLS